MMIPNTLQAVLAQSGGIITTAKANELGISNERLRLMVSAGLLERVAFGIYARPDEFIDEMYIAQLRRKKIIYSHETALHLHDLTDRDPLTYSVTVPSGYNTSRLQEDGFKVYTIKRELISIGVTQRPTIFGNTVTVYNLERTICDCLRSRSQMDSAILIDAIRRYVKRSDKDLSELMKMAELFRVDKLLRSYLEILL